ncbi:hypothetical protein AURDEDRAFT_115051 [Auricularia subglabra TFB-10046 SS5]|nr:hypothetical protein AURDEDRAFT_115051 [Auricularia subglabra TFB-10046 SS5]
MASPTTTKNPLLRRGQSGSLSFAAPPSPYSHQPRPTMHAVQPQPPLALQQSPTSEYPPQRTPPAVLNNPPGSANLNQAPMIAPMYGSAAVAGVPQGTPHSVRRVPPPHYANSVGDGGWGVSEDLRAGEVAVSDVEKGESPYAPIVAQSLQRLDTRHSPRDRDQRGSPQQTADAQAGSSMKPLPAAAPTRGPRVPATTPTRAHSFPQPQPPQAPLQRTQQPSPPTSIAGGRDMYYQSQQQQQVLHRHHTSDSSDSSSPPFKYDASQGQQQGHPGLQRQNSRQLLKTRTPDRSLPFKEEADNDNDHDPEPVRNQPHRLSGQWAGSTTVYDTEAGYAGARQSVDPPQYGGLAHRSPDDTAVDDDLDDDDSEPAANPPGVPASRSNLAELKNMSHHLQEPHEAAATAGADSHSSGTPRSPSAHLPAGMSLAMAQSLMNGDSVLSTSSAGAPLGHLAYDITTDRFDPDVFQNSTLQQLREPLPPPVSNNTRYPAQQQQQARVPQQQQQQQQQQPLHQQQYQRFPVYTNNETIAAQLHKMLQMDDIAAMPSMAASPVYAHYAQHQQHGSQVNSHLHTNGSSAASHHQHPARPDAPEPPTPQEPRGTPYPYTYGLTGYDAQLALLRAQQAAQAGAGSDSAFSPAATPYPVGGAHGIPWFPFLPPHFHAPTARSSPTQSHFDPAGAPFFPGARMAAMAKRKKRNWHSVVVPPRGESTAPPETEYSGDEFTEAQTEIHDDEGLDGHEARGEDEWVDVSDEEDEDLLALEFHPTYVASAERRRKKFDKKWAALVKAFREVDRMTDATMVLLAAPPDARHLLSLSSRAIRRGEAEHATHSPHISTMRASFARLAAQRAAARGSAGISLSDRLAQLSVAGNGGGGNEEALRKALESALASIGMLGRMYEEREARLQNEMLRQAQDRESVEFVLRQALAGTGS